MLSIHFSFSCLVEIPFHEWSTQERKRKHGKFFRGEISSVLEWWDLGVRSSVIWTSYIQRMLATNIWRIGRCYERNVVSGRYEYSFVEEMLILDVLHWSIGRTTFLNWKTSRVSFANELVSLYDPWLDIYHREIFSTVWHFASFIARNTFVIHPIQHTRLNRESESNLNLLMSSINWQRLLPWIIGSRTTVSRSEFCSILPWNRLGCNWRFRRWHQSFSDSKGVFFLVSSFQSPKLFSE